MRYRWFALMLTVLTLVLMPRVGKAQVTQPVQKKPAVSMSQNYPNPFNPEARIKFTVGDFPACSEAGKQYRVSLKVYNILMQVVALPQLEGSSGGVAGGQRLDGVTLPCGEYVGYWNGKYLNTSREVASGVYLWSIDVNGERVVRRSTVAK